MVVVDYKGHQWHQLESQDGSQHGESLGVDQVGPVLVTIQGGHQHRDQPQVGQTQQERVFFQKEESGEERE